nr:hypothetical protein [Rhizobium sp. LCM 4573]
MANDQLLGALNDLWIDHGKAMPLLAAIRHIYDNQTQRHPDLNGGKTSTLLSVHNGKHH